MGTSNRLRLVVFTAGPLAPVNGVFLRRLAGDPLLELAAIMVDEYQRPTKPLAARLLRGLRDEGWSWLWFKATSMLDSLVRNVAVWIFERMHPRSGPEESYETLQRQTGIPVYRVSDIHSEQALALIRSLRPELGVIVGGRILRDQVVTIPRYGTLNIHKRKVPEYRGGGPVGYWEILAGERSIGITIHYATSRVDAGPVLNETTIPIEECDTLESLQIKADIAGGRLYYETIRDFALGRRQGKPQDASRGRTYRSPGEMAVWRLQKRLRRKAEQTMPSLRALPARVAWVRILLQYAVLLPWLLYMRKRLTGKGRAPICIFYYHLAANRPANHMCLPLEGFVRQIEFLRRYYQVISLDEAVRRVRSERNQEVAASITFDDGYRDNVWAIEYLRYFQIPACFFVSIGHILDGSSFEHDRRLGFDEAKPMRAEDIRRLVAAGFIVGSHGIYHEDFGRLEPATAERVLRESRGLIGQVTGHAPEHFSFPRGLAGTNIAEENFALAQRHYRYVYSAYGGYNFPARGCRHLLRQANPAGVLDLVLIMDGYAGFRRCLRGDAWGLKTAALPPTERFETGGEKNDGPSGSRRRAHQGRPAPFLMKPR